MLDTLQQLDTDLFLTLNGYNTPWLDTFMWYFSGKLVWIFLYVSILAGIIYRFGWRRALGILLVIILIITVCDQLCGHFVRYSIERMRPSNPDNPISHRVHIVRGYRGGPFGFPSCHAANSFGLAVFTALLFRSRTITAIMMLWALVTAYSRIVLGVHYPGDLLTGAAVGTLTAITAYYSSRAIYRRYSHRHVTRDSIPTLTISSTMLLTIGIMAITACFTC